MAGRPRAAARGKCDSILGFLCHGSRLRDGIDRTGSRFDSKGHLLERTSGHRTRFPDSGADFDGVIAV